MWKRSWNAERGAGRRSWEVELEGELRGLLGKRSMQEQLGGRDQEGGFGTGIQEQGLEEGAILDYTVAAGRASVAQKRNCGEELEERGCRGSRRLVERQSTRARTPNPSSSPIPGDLRSVRRSHGIARGGISLARAASIARRRRGSPQRRPCVAQQQQQHIAIGAALAVVRY